MRLLVVDDEQTLLHQLTRAFERERYLVVTALDGEEALDKLAEGPVNLIVLDIMLPKLDGLSLLRAIRQSGVTTPVLMLTAKGDPQDKVTGLDLGADDYLAKPVPLAELMARVRALLRRGGAIGKRCHHRHQKQRAWHPRSGAGKNFDQFYRVDKSRSLRHGDSGRRLATVKRIVELHRGTVRLSSDAQGWNGFGRPAAMIRLPRK